MDDTLAELVRALSPVMNAVQAEGFLHLAASTLSKPPEKFDAADWPTVEKTVRDALRGTPSEALSDEVCANLQTVFLSDSPGRRC
jgi:hypothetical protein